MGRLKEHVQATELGSLPSVAKRLAKMRKGGPKWESLANNLRKLDEGEIEWWQGTGTPYWESLWRLLDLSDEGELLQLVLPMSAQSTGDRWRFHQFTELRPLDFTKESPYPGIPERLLDRGGPRGDRTWWVASRGAGKTLLGRWLEARKGWTVLSCPTWAEATEALPTVGRVYLELGSNPGQVPNLSSDLRLCVAASTKAPEHGWDVVETDPSTAWWTDLVRWANERLVDPAGLSELEDPASLRHLVTSPGEGISLLGAVDSVGTRHKHARARWGKHWMRGAVAPIPDPFPVRNHLSEHGFDLLVKAMEGLLREGVVSSPSRRAWREALAGHEAVEPDVDVLLALAQNPTSERKDFVDAIRPSAEAILDGFVRIGLIHDAAGLCSTEHAWVAKLAREKARERLIKTSEGLGALLMHKASVEEAMEHLRLSVVDNRKSPPLAEPAGSPEALAFQDGFVRAVGVVAANAWRETSEVTLERTLVEEAWTLGRQISVQRWENRPEFPVFGLPDGEPGSWSAHSTWFVACLGLSLWLRESGHPISEAGPLNPWSESTDAAQVHQMLEGLVEADLPRGANPAPHAVRLAALSIGERLVEHLGPLQHRNQLARIQLPTLAVLHAGSTEQGLKVEGKLLNYAVTSIRTICRWRAIELADVYRAWWPIWLEHRNGPPYARTSGHGGLPAAELGVIWSALPTESMNSSLYRDVLRRPELWAALGQPLWRAWLAQWTLENRKQEQDEPAAFEAMPEDLALSVLRSAPHPYIRKTRRMLWDRFPEESMRAVDDLAQQAPVVCEASANWHKGVLHDLCQTVPDSLRPSLVERALRWARHSEEFPGARVWVLGWLHQVVNDRATGWRQALDTVLQGLSASQDPAGQDST